MAFVQYLFSICFLYFVICCVVNKDFKVPKMETERQGENGIRNEVAGLPRFSHIAMVGTGSTFRPQLSAPLMMIK